MRILVLSQNPDKESFEIAANQLDVIYCASVMAATAIVEEINPRVVFVDIEIRGSADFLKWLKRETGCAAIVTQEGALTMDYFAWGADAAIQRPFKPSDIAETFTGLGISLIVGNSTISPQNPDDDYGLTGFWDITDEFEAPNSPASDIRQPDYSRAQVIGQEVISIWGAQGGAGKTSLAMLLAESLGDFEVLVVDLNFVEGPGDMNAILELPITPHIGKLLDNSQDRRTGFSDSLIKPKNAKFAVIQPPPTIDQAENISPDDIIELIDQARRMFQIVILDLPDDLSPITLEAIDMSTSVLMVATNSAGGIARLESIKSYIRKDITKALVLNRFDESKGRAKDIAHFLDMPLAGVLQTVNEIATRANQGKLLKLRNNVTDNAINDILKVIFGLDQIRSSPKKTFSGVFKAGLASMHR